MPKMQGNWRAHRISEPEQYMEWHYRIATTEQSLSWSMMYAQKACVLKNNYEYHIAFAHFWAEVADLCRERDRCRS